MMQADLELPVADTVSTALQLFDKINGAELFGQPPGALQCRAVYPIATDYDRQTATLRLRFDTPRNGNADAIDFGRWELRPLGAE